MRSNLEKLRQQLIAFRTEHPERIWSDINAAIQKVTKAEEDLTSKQRVAMLQFQQQGHQRMFEALGDVIGKTLDVPGNIQNQKKLADALNDVNNRNARALQIYEETKTPLEHYNDQVRELNPLCGALAQSARSPT
jgi:23S rRNA pseudoU1915 N3-methylase RlmH